MATTDVPPRMLDPIEVRRIAKGRWPIVAYSVLERGGVVGFFLKSTDTVQTTIPEGVDEKT